MAAALVWLARCILAATLIAAPWALGGADPPLQRWLMIGVGVAGAIGWLGVVLGRTAALSRPAVAGLMLAAGLIVIGAIQLLPHPHLPVFRSAELTETLSILVGGDSPATSRSLEPAATRLWMARVAVAISAFLSGAWLFGESRSRRWLWAILTLNGVAVVGFGLVQRSLWNGKLYWTIPLELGGQPFAAFVNRNNAAEYLSMCLAGALGLWATSRLSRPTPTLQQRRPATPHDLIARVPGTAWGVMVLLLFGGVLATLSRAGALSAVVGVLLVGVWAGAGRRTSMFILPLLGIIVAAGIWIGVSNQAAPLRTRLQTLGNSYSTDGRIQHWTDMREAVRDFPSSGTGFGTYRYANKPYESRRSESWFESADNQYLDLLVEGGFPAAAIAGLLILLAAWVAHDWKHRDQRPEALAAGYALVATGLQSITDCWLATAANLLTLSTLAGSLSSTGASLNDAQLSPLGKVERLMESRRSYWPAVCIGLCTVITSALGAYEIDAAARSTVFRRDLPDIEQRGEWTAAQLDGPIAVGEQLASRRPDDAELHAALARLWFYRYRLDAAVRLDVVGPDHWKETARWQRSSPEALLGTLTRYVRIGDTASLKRFYDHPSVVENLAPMSRHLRAARRSCPILPHIGLLEAIDAALNNGNPAIPLRREAALSPVRVKLLEALAQSAEYVDDGQLFTVCLRRCLDLDPGHAGDYVETARRRLSEPQIIERLLPRQPDLLLDFAQEARSPAGKERALTEATAAIQERPPGDPDLTFLRGRLTRGRGDISAAIAELQQAVADQPLEPIRKLHLAEALLADGQPEAASEQLDAARRLAPDDRQIKARIRELESRFESP